MTHILIILDKILGNNYAGETDVQMTLHSLGETAPDWLTLQNMIESTPPTFTTKSSFYPMFFLLMVTLKNKRFHL
jgi:hypothetical protein